MTQIQSIKEEIDSVNIEIQQEERALRPQPRCGAQVWQPHFARDTCDYDLNALRSPSTATSFRHLAAALAALEEYQKSGKAMLREEVRCPASLPNSSLLQAPFQTCARPISAPCAPHSSPVRAPFEPECAPHSSLVRPI